MSFTVENLEYFLLILVRISSFVMSAPFFSQTNTPARIKAFLSFFIAILIFQVLKYEPLAYTGVIGYAGLVIKEAIVGLLIGFMCQIVMYILEFSGKLIDMEIGFSMVNTLDPTTNLQTSITGTLYSTLVFLMLMITNMHHYILSALVDSFKLVPLGRAVFRPNIYTIMMDFISNYFMTAFRIILPVFCSILIVNVVLGILAKVAQQMNMFVIGIQLKLIVGLFVMFMVAGLIPVVSGFLFDEMKLLVEQFIRAVMP